MIPIYEQGHGKGIGYSFEKFSDRLTAICAEHLQTRRAKAIAIILRDATSPELGRILRDQGVFTLLDRLSGNELSVFFLHTSSDEALERFNNLIGIQLGLEGTSLPAVAFFRLTSEKGQVGFTDVEVQSLNHSDLIHGFHELHGMIEAYISRSTVHQDNSLWTKAKGATRFVTLEAIRGAIREGIGALFW